MNQSVKTVDISIVIPVYNESRKIAVDLREAYGFIRRHAFSGEVVVVDDGSDDQTAEVAAHCRPPQNISLKILKIACHRGKGFAVRHGMSQTLGRYILFIDSGHCIPYEEIMRGMYLIDKGECEIAHASRRLPQSIIARPQSWRRRAAAWLFRKFFTKLLGIPSYLTDSQAGLKIYHGDIGRTLYRAATIDGFLFDAEIILRALHAGYRIKEFPITWHSDPDSRLRLLWLPFILLRDAVLLKWRLHKEFRHQT